MRVKVLFFGRLKEIVGRAEDFADLADGARIEQLFAHYGARHPELARFRASLQGRLLALVSVGQIAGTVTGVSVGAVLVEHVSYFLGFAVAFGLQGLALVVALALVRGGWRSAPVAATEPRVTAGWRELRALLSLNVVLLILLIMLLGAAVAMLTPDIGPYRDRTLLLTRSEFVLVLAAPAAIAAALLVPSGYIADRFGRNLPLGLGLVIFPVSLLLITLTRAPVLASLFACGAAVGYVLCLPALSASLLDLSSEGNRGLLTGFSTAIQAVGGVVAPPIGGLLIDGLPKTTFHGFGPLAPFRASAALMAGTFLLALVYAGRTRHVYRDRVNADAITSPGHAEV